MINQAILCFTWIICSGFAANQIAPPMSDIDNQTALVGENVTFLCESLTDGYWRFHLMQSWNISTRNSNPGKVCVDQRICVFDLFNVTKADQGWYTCFVGYLKKKLKQPNNRTAWLTVLSENDIPPPENVSTLHTPDGVLVRWDQPKTALEVTSFRTYYKSNYEDNLDIWKHSDASGTASHILIQGFQEREDYTLKIQAIYNNYRSRNVSRTVFSAATVQHKKSNTHDSEYKVFLFSGISAMLILTLACFGFALRKRYQNIHTGKVEVNQSNRSGSNTSERQTERESGLYEEIDDFRHSYDSITSNSLLRQRSLIFTVQDESYNRERLGSLTATKVLYTDNNEKTNYINPVYSQTDSNTRLSQYAHGRIPEYLSSTDNINRVNTAIDADYLHGRVTYVIGNVDNINQETAAIDSDLFMADGFDDIGRTNDIFQEIAAMDSRECHSVYVQGRLPENVESPSNGGNG